MKLSTCWSSPSFWPLLRTVASCTDCHRVLPRCSDPRFSSEGSVDKEIFFKLTALGPTPFRYWTTKKGNPARLIEEPTEIQTKIIKAFGYEIEGGVLHKSN